MMTTRTRGEVKGQCLSLVLSCMFMATMLYQTGYKLRSLQVHILPCSYATLVCALNMKDTAVQEPVTGHPSQGLKFELS